MLQDMLLLNSKIVIRTVEKRFGFHFIEFGNGNVLTGLVKRILPDARVANVSDPKSLQEALDLVR